jgi:hypothetical protein
MVLLKKLVDYNIFNEFKKKSFGSPQVALNNF